MANHKSAIKRNRQSIVRRSRNNVTRSRAKTAAKTLLTAVEQNESAEKLDGLFRRASGYISQAAAKGVIHKNTAARRISRLAKRVQTAASK